MSASGHGLLPAHGVLVEPHRQARLLPLPPKEWGETQERFRAWAWATPLRIGWDVDCSVGRRPVLCRPFMSLPRHDTWLPQPGVFSLYWVFYLTPGPLLQDSGCSVGCRGACHAHATRVFFIRPRPFRRAWRYSGGLWAQRVSWAGRQAGLKLGPDDKQRVRVHGVVQGASAQSRRRDPVTEIPGMLVVSGLHIPDFWISAPSCLRQGPGFVRTAPAQPQSLGECP